MTGSGGEPAEISVNFGRGEWTEASLAALVGSYQDEIEATGGATKDVVSQIHRLADGSVSVHVGWVPRATIMKPMTGQDGAVGPVLEESKAAGHVLDAEVTGETYVELRDEQPFAEPYPGEGARRPRPANYRGEARSAVSCLWYAVAGACLFAAAVGIGWMRCKISNEAETHDRH